MGSKKHSNKSCYLAVWDPYYSASRVVQEAKIAKPQSKEILIKL